MYQVKIEKEIEKTKTVTILPGQVIPNQDGSDSGSVNEGNSNIQMDIDRSSAEILVAEQDALFTKEDEVQAKIDAYVAAQEHQKQNGGPGPVADFETMKICNEHHCAFEVVFKEEE